VQGGGRRGRWVRDYREAVDEFWEAGVGMLEGEWMILPGTVDSDREDDFDRMRKVYIPIVVRRLHGCLIDAWRVLGSTAQKRIWQLITIVADRRNGLYDEMSVSYVGSGSGDAQGKSMLELYLEDVREAVIMGLDVPGASGDVFAGIVT